MSNENKPLPTPLNRSFLSFVIPVVGAIIFGLLVGGSEGLDTRGQQGLAVQLAGFGLASFYLGRYWYGLAGLGLRGKRPLYASIGFAALAWFVFLLLRFFLVELIEGIVADNLGRSFVYLLLFEGFALQLWTFGLLFRSLADWRGPLTSAIACGIIFGGVNLALTLILREELIAPGFAPLYFIIWGTLYGIIRLRTGSLLGIVLIQAMHSWTTWYILAPPAEPDPGQLSNLYLVSTIIYLIIMWRLWPKEEEDYRV